MSGFTSAEILRPRVIVSDRGESPNSATCELRIDLFIFEDTATATLEGNVNFFNLEDVEKRIGEVLNIEIDFVNARQLNSTHFEIDFFGRDDNDNLILADKLVEMFISLSDQDKGLLEAAGIFIKRVTSNAPQPTPTSPAVPTRPIPTWAVAVIVVMNSVIIIGVLLIILGIIWRRYKR